LSKELRLALSALVAGSENEQRLLNVLRSKLDGVVKGLENHAKLSNNKFDALIAGLDNQTRLLNEKLNAFIPQSNRPPGRY
jgi:hypothetical protein